jgi:hypothetical protein
MAYTNVVVITGRYWGSRGYSIDGYPRGEEYHIRQGNHSIPPYLICDNEDHTQLFAAEDPLGPDNQNRIMTALFPKKKLPIEEAILFVHGFSTKLEDATETAERISSILEGKTV